MIEKIENKIIMIFILNSFLLMLLYLTELRINININSTFNFILIFIIGIIFFIELVVFINEVIGKWSLKNIKIKKNVYFNLKSILWASMGIIICFIFIGISGMQNIFLKVLILIIATEIILDALVNAKPSSFIYNKEKMGKNKNLIRLDNKRIGDITGAFPTKYVWYFFFSWLLGLVPSSFLPQQNHAWLNAIIVYLICFLMGSTPMYYLDLFLGDFVIVECICTSEAMRQHSNRKRVDYRIENARNKIDLYLTANTNTYSKNEKIVIIMGGYSKFIFDSYRKDIAERMKIDIDMHL